jgi:hypothetical protein
MFISVTFIKGGVYVLFGCLGSCLPPQPSISSVRAFPFILVMSGWYRTPVKVQYNEMHGIEVAQSDVLSIPPMAHYRCVVTCSPIRGPTTLSGLRLVYQMISSNIQIAPKFYGTHLARGLAPASIQVSSFQQPCTTLVVIYICI